MCVPAQLPRWGGPHLRVSRIIVKSTNLPSKGTTSEVGGMISASSKKNTVSDSRMLMDSDTWRTVVVSDSRMLMDRTPGEQ